MSSHRKGDLSAATQVKVLSPEISIVARGQAFHCVETRNELRDKNGVTEFGSVHSRAAVQKKKDEYVLEGADTRTLRER